jgi:hypothetical protein
MKRNRAFVEKLKGKLINLTEICDHIHEFPEYTGEYVAFVSRKYGQFTNEQVSLINPYVLVVKTRKSSIQFVGSDGQIYWMHLSS